jgi:hypothetical protein
MIDLEGIEDHLSYDPVSGLFHWLATGKGKRSDLVAGSNYSKGYTQLIYKGKKYQAHRVAFWFMTGAMPTDDVDHINGVKVDNSWSNLREATRSENLRNMKARVGASKYKGVTKNGNDWRARIFLSGLDRKNLGCFTCEKEAALAYNYAALKHFGSFARFSQVFYDMPTADRVSIY